MQESCARIPVGAGFNGRKRMRMAAPMSRLHPPVGLMCIGPG